MVLQIIVHEHFYDNLVPRLIFIHFLQVDLFFYREPEEAKEREEEEVAQAEYVPTYTLGAEQWPTEVAEGQWESEAPPAPGIVPPIIL